MKITETITKGINKISKKCCKGDTKIELLLWCIAILLFLLGLVCTIKFLVKIIFTFIPIFCIIFVALIFLATYVEYLKEQRKKEECYENEDNDCDVDDADDTDAEDEKYDEDGNDSKDENKKSI